MKIIVIGSVAAGTSVAAKARRNDENAEIVIYDRDDTISYAVCGIPYAIGGEVADFHQLTPRDAEWFLQRYNVLIKTKHEINKIDPQKKQVEGIDLLTGQTFSDQYDQLVLATGSLANVPTVFEKQTYENVFQIKNIHSGQKIQDFIQKEQVKQAVIVGAGYIGLEMAEQLTKQGIKVTLLQRSQQPMSQMDWDMALRLLPVFEREGIDFKANATVASLQGDKRIETIQTTRKQIIKTDLVIVATGVKPNNQLAKSIGITLGESGAVQVDTRFETNLKDIYAVGDVAESFNLLTKRPMYRPLASTANKMGRIAGDAITGGKLRHRGILGTSILRFFDMTVAQTGLTEKQALAEGFDIATLYNIKPNKPTYMGGKEMVIKAIANRQDGRLLGVQIVGFEGVDKRIDVLATAMTFGAVAQDLFHLDLAYAPPFSTTKDPVLFTGMALDNAVSGKAALMTPMTLMAKQANNEPLQIIDTRSQAQYEAKHVKGAIHIPLAKLRQDYQKLDKDIVTVTYCNKGVTGNAAQNILLNLGFKAVYNLSGGHQNYQTIRSFLIQNQ